MKLIDHLDNETKNKLIKMRRRKQSKKKRRKNISSNEHLTEWDIKELMGINRDRYERRRGAVRRK